VRPWLGITKEAVTGQARIATIIARYYKQLRRLRQFQNIQHALLIYFDNHRGTPKPRTWPQMARGRVRSLNASPLLGSKLMCYSASSCGIFQVRTLGHKRSQRHVECGQEKDHIEDQEASAQAFNSRQLERERDHQYASTARVMY
jgi:hypothetical protein